MLQALAKLSAERPSHTSHVFFHLTCCLDSGNGTCHRRVLDEPANRDLSRGLSERLGNLPKFTHYPEVGFQVSISKVLAATPHVVFRELSLLVKFPRKQTLGQRAIGDDPHFQSLRVRQQIPFNPAIDKVVGYLKGFQPMPLLGESKLFDGKI